MSFVNIIMTPAIVNELEKSRYFKHDFVACLTDFKQPIFIYSRMRNDLIINGKMNAECLNFLKSLQIDHVYFFVGQLAHRQGELDLVQALFDKYSFKKHLLTKHLFNDYLAIKSERLSSELIILENTIYRIQ